VNLLAIALLQSCRSAAPYGVPVATLVTHVRAAGHREATVPEVETQLRALGDSGCVSRLAGLLGPSWRLTALGADALKEAGL